MADEQTTKYTSLHWADILVFSLSLFFSLVIGAYYGWKSRRQQELQDYLLGGRHLELLPVTLSLLVSFQSAISIIGIPAETYMYGTMFTLQALGFIVSVILCCFTIVPMMHHLRLTSVYEYLEMRFKSKTLRLFGTALGILQMILYMGITLYAPAVTLYAVAGVPLWVSVVVIGLIGTVYTCIGGMRSVVWTDVLQCIMIFTGLLAIVIKGLLVVGGFSKMKSSMNASRRIEFDNVEADPRVRHTVWGCVIGVVFAWMSIWCSQSSVQRIVSLKSSKAAQRAFLLQIPVMILYISLLSFIGLLMYTYYNMVRCDPLDSGTLQTINQLMPYFVFDILQEIPGLSGLFICTLFSGALSTLSSGINALSANTVKDLLGTRLDRSTKISDTLVAKIAVIFYGGLITGIAYLMRFTSGSVIQVAMSAFGSIGGPIAGLFFLGGLFPQANWLGSFIGIFTSLILNTWLSVGAQLYGSRPKALPPNPIDGCYSNFTTSTGKSVNFTIERNSTLLPTTLSNGDVRDFTLYDISYVWYGFIGFWLSIVVGLIASVVLKKVMPGYFEVDVSCWFWTYVFMLLIVLLKITFYFGFSQVSDLSTTVDDLISEMRTIWCTKQWYKLRSTRPSVLYCETSREVIFRCSHCLIKQKKANFTHQEEMKELM